MNKEQLQKILSKLRRDLPRARYYKNWFAILSISSQIEVIECKLNQPVEETTNE